MPLRFNLSHCDGLVLCGVTRDCDIGVDCENLNRHVEIEKLAARVFSAREQEFFNSMPAPMRTKTFFRIWTLKEAYVKARGLGMSLPLEKFSFDLAASNGFRIAFSPEVQDQSEDWQFVQPTLSVPFVAAVAVKSPREEPLSIELHRA
jgi:4'-phosphopantetheinyl transferase